MGKQTQIYQIEISGNIVDGKKCSKCGEIKPLVNFSKSRKSKSGRQSACKECRKLICKESWENSVEVCVIEGCNNTLRANGYCSKHYARWKEHGNPETIIIKARKSRTENETLLELLEFYETRNKKQFYSSDLMVVNSGLERCIRTKFGGLREFCKKHSIEYILTPPKIINWTDDIAVATLNEIFEKVNSPLNMTILTKEGLGKLYQWITRSGYKFEDYCVNNGIGHIVGTVNLWDDAKCYRLIKDYFLENKRKITPELIKINNKGAHGYIYNKHGNFDEFINKFDLQEYIEVNNLIYTNEIAIQRIKEVYLIKGEKVNSKWLVDHGYAGLARYIVNLGNGDFTKGCENLGIEEFTYSCYMDWTDEIALLKINKMLNKKKSPLIRQDFKDNDLNKLAVWIIKEYGDIDTFFNKYNMADKFTNMAHVGRELWSYGIRFEKLIKEVIELFFEDVKYNKWVEHLNIRPDFIIGDSGLWIDAKLSSFAYFTDDTVEKYTSHEECKELWLICLRGHKFRIDNPKTKVIWIDEYYDRLKEIGRDDLINQIESLRDEIITLEKTG